MSLTDCLILTLWVERRATCERLADLLLVAHGDVFGTLGVMARERMVEWSVDHKLNQFRLTDIGLARARVLLAERTRRKIQKEGKDARSATTI